MPRKKKHQEKGQKPQQPQQKAAPAKPRAEGAAQRRVPPTEPNQVQVLQASQSREEKPSTPFDKEVLTQEVVKTSPEADKHVPSKEELPSVRAIAIPSKETSDHHQMHSNQAPESSKPALQIMNRPPSASKTGSAIKLLCNHFPFKLVKQTIYQYAVVFTPECESKRIRFTILNEQRELLGRSYIFDGAMLFLVHPIQDVDVHTTNADREITVSITQTRILQPDSTGAPLQLYNVIFRKILRGLKLKQIGRQYFDPTQPIRIPKHNVELWPGYFTAINPNSLGTMLIADVTHKVLRTDTVLDLLYELSRTGNRLWKQLATQQLIGQIVLTRYNNRTYRIDDIDWNLNPGSTFTKRTGETLSYFNYYASVYEKNLTELEQPLLVHRHRRKGSDDEVIYLLPELCSMTGITEQMRNDFTVMKDITAHTRVYPAARANGVLSFVTSIANSADVKKELESWNITLDTKMLAVEGKVLPAEAILFGKGVKGSYDPKTAEWSALTKNSPLISAVHLNSWVLIFAEKNTAQANEFADKLRQVSVSVGLTVGKPEMVMLKNDSTNSYLEAIKTKLTPQTQCVVCILPSPKKDRYDAIKRLCCVERPVPSQCILARSLNKKQTILSVSNKIMQQINCKMGGELWNLSVPLSHTMMIGIDVCHDTHSRGGKQSVAGFCASTNREWTRYYSRVIFQGPGQELVSGLKICMKEALRAYYEKNKSLPQRIIVYRDGVGDGMLDGVVEHEIPQILETCRSVAEDYKPKIAVVVVKKRIHTRLFFQQQGELCNPPPGTVVDTGCVHPDWYDFFLVSQSVNQGTVTPSHYHVIVDDTGLSPEQMQKLTYKMCHLYYNWPGTIRVPAPCHYAHKIAFLVGQSIHADPALSLRDKLYFL